jgi:transcriptional regulator with XRE-family HTH domain
MNLHNRIQRDIVIAQEYAKGARQIDLAEKLGLSQPTISNAIRNGKFWIETLNQIRDAKEEYTTGFPGHLDNVGEDE